MATVHPTTVFEGDDVELADDVEIGPGCVISGPVSIGAGTRLIGRVWLQGPLRIGAGNVIYPNACLGFGPQSVSYDREKPGKGMVIGDRNVMREGFTAHRAMTDDGPTRIGDDNFLMTNTHVGHDTQFGNRCIMASGAVIGGHAVIEDRVNIGGSTPIHQFCIIGEGAMLGGAIASRCDVPPWFMLTGVSVVSTVNLIGLRRAGFAPEEIDEVRWVYRVLYRRGHTIRRATEALEERSDRKIVKMYLDFLARSTRGIGRSRATGSRGAVVS